MAVGLMLSLLRHLLLLLGLVLLAADSPALALRVAPESPCTAHCPNPTVTLSSEISCSASAFDDAGNAVATAFVACLSCLESSTYIALAEDGGESDRQWYLCECYHPSP
jgi:hypothetical protein